MSCYKFQPTKGVSLFQEGVSPILLEKERERKGRNRKEKKKTKGEKRRERKEEGKSERAMAPHTQAAHANKSLGCSSSFSSLCCSTQIDQASPRSIVPTHEAGVSHGIITTIPRNPSFMLAVSILR